MDEPKDEARRRAERRYAGDIAARGDLDAEARKAKQKESKARTASRRATETAERAPRLDALGDEELDLLPSHVRHRGRRSDAVVRRAGKVRRSPVASAGEAPASAGTPSDVDAGAAAREAADTPIAGEALVVAITRGVCEVEIDGVSRLSHLPKALALAQQSELAVGDRVRLARRPAGDLFVASVLPRTNRLSRPDPFLAHRERILAANVDLAVVVVALRRPPLSLGLIDRFLVALAHGGVRAAVAVNKVDLAEPDAANDPELASLAPYARLGVPLIYCSAKSREGISELRELVSGKTVVFVGHSGVGKSSLLHAVAPDFEVRVNDVSALNDKGRHTTTRARIYRLDDGVTRIVDTPGVREFGLWKMMPRELSGYFDDFAVHTPECRFADCSHTHEPDCAVRAAADSGRLDPQRYQTYLRILESLAAS